MADVAWTTTSKKWRIVEQSSAHKHSAAATARFEQPQPGQICGRLRHFESKASFFWLKINFEF
jgi:hypothetical protein